MIIGKANVFKAIRFIFSMVRIRRVNTYGTRYVIELMKTDMVDLDLTVGDFVDIDDIIKRKMEKARLVDEEQK